MPRPPRVRALAALVALAGLAASDASASTVRLSYRLFSDRETPAAAILDYRAARGEANDLTIGLLLVSQTSAVFLVRDAGATVRAGRGCASVDPNEVRCPAGGIWGGSFEAVVRLADGRDRVVAAEDVSGALLDGGAGHDTLVGTLAGDVLVGGPGSDVLDGGGGSDWASWAERREPVRADLDGVADDGVRGERDELRSVENLRGGAGDDVLVGNAGANVLAGRGGGDRLRGGRGADTLFGQWGRDVLRARDGDVDRVHGGPGRDRGVVDEAVDVVRAVEVVF